MRSARILPVDDNPPSPPRRDGAASGAPLRCIACRYDLANLPRTAVCPECATPVRWSIEARRLDGWQTERLREIAAACPWAWSLPGVVAAGLLLGFCWGLGGPRSSDNPACVLVLVLALMIGAAVTSTIAWSTILQPASAPPFSAAQHRTISIVAGVLCAAGITLLALASLLARGSPGLGQAAIVAFITAALAGPVHLAASLLGLARLARAIRRDAWARWSKVLAALAVAPPATLLAAGVALSNAISRAYAPSPRAAPTTAETLVATVSGIIIVVGSIASLVLLVGGAGLLAKLRAAVLEALARPDREPAPDDPTASGTPSATSHHQSDPDHRN